MKLHPRIFASCLVAATAVLGCASTPGAADLDRITADMVKASFREEGIAKIDCLVQDDSNRECSAAEASGKPIDALRAKGIEEANLGTVK